MKRTNYCQIEERSPDRYFVVVYIGTQPTTDTLYKQYNLRRLINPSGMNQLSYTTAFLFLFFWVTPEGALFEKIKLYLVKDQREKTKIIE